MKPELNTTRSVGPSVSSTQAIVSVSVAGSAKESPQSQAIAVNNSEQFSKVLETNSESLEQNKAQLREMVDKLNLDASSVSRSLRFQFDDEANRSVIQVYDRETEQLIRQIPSEEALARLKNAGGNVFQLIDTEA